MEIQLLRSYAWSLRWLAVWLAIVAALLALPSVGRGAASSGINEATGSPPISYFALTNWMGPWIWASNTFDGQTCQFWHAFEIPSSSSITNARLIMTCDDEFTLFLDGRELGRGVDWREAFVFDLTPILTTGKHVLGIRAFNAAFAAGITVGMRVQLTDGRVIELKSGPSWRVVPDSEKRWQTRLRPPDDWPKAIVESPLGHDPWTPWPINIIAMSSLQPIDLAFWQTGWFQLTLLTVCGLVIVVSLRLMAQLALHRKERWLLQQERSRIAREIHDDIGARMTQLVLHGEVAQCGLPESSPAQQQLIQMCDEARGLLSTMDEILWAVNPQRDTLRDFAAYVCKYAEEFLKHTQIQCLFDVEAGTSPANFNLPLRRSLFLAIKETLNNAVKYSGATELRLRIRWAGERLVVVVQDNGKGFDPAMVNPERHGLANMRQRMAELGGSCLVTSQPGTGCLVEFNVPLKRPRTGLMEWLSRPKSSMPTTERTGNN